MSIYDTVSLNTTPSLTPIEEQVLTLSTTYRKLIFQKYLEPEESNPNYSKLTKDHLSWMCDQLVIFTDPIKSNRWLGYIHGVLAMDGCLIVEEV